MEEFHYISPEFLSLDEVEQIIDKKLKLKLSEESEKAIVECRTFLDEKMERATEPIYGINTGFGSLCDTEISKSDLKKLQRNLVTSHACGMGAAVPKEIVKLMLLLKIQGISLGHSGVQLATVKRLIDFYNEGVYPIIYEQGSLGASGDLAPLAHLALPLLGEGEVKFQGKRLSGAELNQKMNWQPIELMSKEGLALLNGTQFMSGYATHILIQLKHLLQWSDFAAAASVDAFDGRISPFNDLLHQIRPHRGQIETAQAIRKHLEGSEIIDQPKQSVQDPYCMRCSPQVHGATKDTVNYARQVVETEINSVTDNPTIFKEEDEILSGGNFHGQPLALVLDYLSIAIAEIASISERRTYKLVSGKRGLPDFLVDNPGLNSGFMIVQYAAASAVSQNKQLSTPASVDSIDSSNGQEDHVSMGANAATKLLRVLENYEKILGIEWLTACQALHFRGYKTSPAIKSLIDQFRKEVPFVAEDQSMYPLMQKARAFVKGIKLK
ncbi:MAG: histidine ammonia-lyase [Vicingaceae bacterium]